MLGLPASASQAEVFEAADALGLAARLGAVKRFDKDLAWLGEVARAEGDLRDALGRLSDPPRRAAERLFWFHAAPPAEAPPTVDAARRAGDELLAAGGPAARHDAALFLLAALHRLDPRLREREAWAAAFGLWREVCEAEEFWSLLVASDLKGEYEQVLTFAEAAELRLRAPRLVSQRVAAVAFDAAAAEDLGGVGRSLAVLRAAALPRPLLEEYENEALGPFHERAETACDTAFAWADLFSHNTDLLPSDRKERYYDAALHRFNGEVKPQLSDFLDAAGPDSYHLRRLARYAAAKLNALAGYYRREGWTEQAAAVYRSARALAPADSAEFAEAGEALRELGAGGPEAGAAESAAGADDYAARLARELNERSLPPGLFKAPAAAAAAASSGGESFKGCLLQLAFYGLMVASCFALDQCGIIKMGRRTTYPPAYNFNSFSFNYNYRAPAPQFSPVPIPDLYPPLDVKLVKPAELRRLMRRGSVVVVDVRALAEYEAGHIAGAVSVPEPEVAARAPELRARRRQVVFYCACEAERASLRAARRLRLEGVENVAVLEGGLDAWRAAGLPFESSVERAVTPPAVVEQAAPSPESRAPAGPSP